VIGALSEVHMTPVTGSAVSTLSDERPLIRRVLRYYGAVATAGLVLQWAFPATREALFAVDAGQSFVLPQTALFLLVIFGVVVLVPPISWSYGATRRARSRYASSSVISAVLPATVACLTLVVPDSLAFALLAGAVVVVLSRYPEEQRPDPVIVLLSLALGVTAGSHLLAAAAIMSAATTAAFLVSARKHAVHSTPHVARVVARENAPADVDGRRGARRAFLLARSHRSTHQPSWPRDELDLALFGTKPKKPRYNASLLVFSSDVSSAQVAIGHVLDDMTKRWQLHGVVHHTGQPSEIQYRLRLRKSQSPEELEKAIRSNAGAAIVSLNLDEVPVSSATAASDDAHN
jgi:hypothetical protein